MFRVGEKRMSSTSTSTSTSVALLLSLSLVVGNAFAFAPRPFGGIPQRRWRRHYNEGVGAAAPMMGRRGPAVTTLSSSRILRSSTMLSSRTIRRRYALFAKDKDGEDDDEEEEEEGEQGKKRENPYADPNYPDLEFIDYSDPNYKVDQGVGDEFFSNPASGGGDADGPATTEEMVEEMREDRRRRNDEFQFQTYYTHILDEGETYKGEWSVYKTSTFMPSSGDDAGGEGEVGIPRLLKAGQPMKVISRAYKKVVESDSDFPVDAERILHEEVLATDEEIDASTDQAWRDDLDIDSGFGRQNKEEEGGDGGSSNPRTKSPEAIATEREIIANSYWPEELAAKDFRGHQGIMCVGSAYTICTSEPLIVGGNANNGDHDVFAGPFSEYRVEVGLKSDPMRFRIKLDYAIIARDEKKKNGATETTATAAATTNITPPPLRLKSMTVCRETRNSWPRGSGKKMRSVEDRTVDGALFGSPGAEGGLYDPPPVGCDDQAGRYLMLDLEGRATVLLPYMIDQDPGAFDGNGWVTTLDWTPGSMRLQVDRKVAGGPGLRGLRTLELSEVQSADAETYRPRDGGAHMRQ